MPGLRFAELEALVQRDEAVRAELVERGELFGGYHPEMEALHTANGRTLEVLIDQFGWPDEAQDGVAACANAWLIVQHAISLPSLQRKVLALLKMNPAGCTPPQLAMLEDRTLVFSGKMQRYGTQFDWDSNGELNPFPIEDAGHVDIRRTGVGLPPLKETSARLRERAEKERDKPPPDFLEYVRGREEWMIRAGWIRERSEIDAAYRAHE